MTELVRYLAIAEMMALLTCGTYLHLGYRHAVPRGLWWVGIAYAVVLLGVALAVLVNILSPVPPTPGVRFLVWFNAAPTMAVASFTAAVMASNNPWNGGGTPRF